MLIVYFIYFKTPNVLVWAEQIYWIALDLKEIKIVYWFNSINLYLLNVKELKSKADTTWSYPVNVDVRYF